MCSNACPIWHNGNADERWKSRPPAERLLFPHLFSAVSNRGDAKVRYIISGQLRHKLILLFGRSAPIIIQKGAITAFTPVSWFSPYINIWLKGLHLLPSLIYPLAALISIFFPSQLPPLLSHLWPFQASFFFFAFYLFTLPHFPSPVSFPTLVFFFFSRWPEWRIIESAANAWAGTISPVTQNVHVAVQ